MLRLARHSQSQVAYILNFGAQVISLESVMLGISDFVG